MKKSIKMITLVFLSFAILLVGCTGGNNGGNNGGNDGGKSAPAPKESAKKNNNSGGDKAGNEGNSNVSPPGEFPIVKEKEELTVLVAGDARIESMEDNAFTKWYEEQTNIHINWEIAPEGSVAETLNLRLASGDFPDIFMSMGVTRAQEMIYGQQGVFVPLNDLIEEQGFYIKEMFAEKPEYYDGIVTPDGNIYGLPEINECYHCSASVKMWVNNKFLDAVGMGIPQSTEEFYQMLKAFKEQDPNGNGKADEIPLIGGIPPGTWNSDVWLFLMNAFVYTPPTRTYLNEGKVVASFNQDGWKEGLKYLNRLYNDGLLAGESFTQDGQQLRQLGENPEIAIVGAFPAGWFGVGTEYGGASGRWKEYATSIPPLEGPDGLRIAPSFPYQYTTGKAVITSAAKNPEVAFRWLEGFYNQDVSVRANSGEPGTDWVEAEPGEKGIDGRPAKRRAISSYSEVSNTRWYQKSPAYTSDDLRLELSAGEKPEENLEVILFNQTNSNYEPHRAPIDMVIPPLYFSEEQSTELADLEKTILDYVDQMTARFVTGDMSIDGEWENFQATLKSMNLARYLEIHQEAYDATR